MCMFGAWNYMVSNFGVWRSMTRCMTRAFLEYEPVFLYGPIGSNIRNNSLRYDDPIFKSQLLIFPFYMYDVVLVKQHVLPTQLW